MTIPVTKENITPCYSTEGSMITALANFGIEATGNPVKDYLLYFKAWCQSCDKSENFRRTHDLDCILANGDLSADTIFSFWIPLKMYLQAQYPDRYNGGMRGTPKKNAADLDILLDDFAKLLNTDTGRKFYRFAELSQTKSNVMLIPDRKMQSRGVYWLDQMPVMLQECFTGRFRQYFNKLSVEEWVQKENLSAFFEGTPSSASIRSLGPVTANGPHWCNTVEEVDAMIDAYIDILSTR